MSATGRGGERVEHDNYGTPAWSVHRLLERCPLPGGRWIEPCASEGAIIRAVNEVRRDVRWDAIEIREPCLPKLEALLPGHAAGGSFLTDYRFPKTPVGGRKPYRVMLTNPPYGLAQEFLEKGLRIADYVALLLRVNYLGSKGRADFLQANMPDTYVLPDRPCFVVRMTWDKASRAYKRTTTDATEYAWLVWESDVPRRTAMVEILDRTPDAVLEAQRAAAPVIFG